MSSSVRLTPIPRDNLLLFLWKTNKTGFVVEYGIQFIPYNSIFEILITIFKRGNNSIFILHLILFQVAIDYITFHLLTKRKAVI